MEVAQTLRGAGPRLAGRQAGLRRTGQATNAMQRNTTHLSLCPARVSGSNLITSSRHTITSSSTSVGCRRQEIECQLEGERTAAGVPADPQMAALLVHGKPADNNRPSPAAHAAYARQHAGGNALCQAPELSLHAGGPGLVQPARRLGQRRRCWCRRRPCCRSCRHAGGCQTRP